MQARFDLGSDEDDDVQGLIVETRILVASRQEKLNALQSQSPVRDPAPRSQSPLAENSSSEQRCALPFEVTGLDVVVRLPIVAHQFEDRLRHRGHGEGERRQKQHQRREQRRRAQAHAGYCYYGKCSRGTGVCRGPRRHTRPGLTGRFPSVPHARNAQVTR